ncbi:MAG TPA: calcium/sodium antiporter [Candidatus Scatovivens faecipullorum]|nr:calcium/sodium antiporter [Candidatus Scatovivens faecipullorum]
MILNIIFIIVGFFLLVKGADLLVDGSSRIARKFNVKEIIIGLTIVSIGTSMPELIISVTSALKNQSDFAIGNILGSNISNLFFILGVCAIIKPLLFKKQTVKIEIPFVIFLTALLYIFGNNGDYHLITELEGIIFIVFCVLFTIYNIFISKNINNSEMEKNKNKDIKLSKSFLLIMIGIILLKFGGDFVVDNASRIATLLGISERVISLTIVAISTSLPELITSALATYKGEIDLAIGNIIGSNILNIVLIVGIMAIINPIPYSVSFNKDLMIFLIGMIFLFIVPFIGEKYKIERVSGYIYLISYFIYISSLVFYNI